MLCTKCTGQEAPAELIWSSHREKGRESAALNPGLGNCHSPGGSSSKRLLAKELPGAEGDPGALPGCRINWSHPILESCSHPSLGTPKDQENFKIRQTHPWQGQPGVNKLNIFIACSRLYLFGIFNLFNQ